MIDHRLISRINSGRCFALIGSGPSCEIGYPSWKRLSVATRDHVLGTNPKADQPSYDTFLKKQDYPALFRQAEIDLGGRGQLASLIRSLLVPRDPRPDFSIYQLLTRWPFACYLTTNFDDELSKHLRDVGQHYDVVQNRPEDLALLRDGASHLIVKLHSDLDHPELAVITSLDYDRLLSHSSAAYFREKVRQVFEMFDIFILGHGMNDPDLQLILRIAKHMANPLHPIYMALGNITSGQVREYREQYNINIVRYQDSDGTHSQLRRILGVGDHFVVPRHARIAYSGMVDDKYTEAAASLLLYRRLRDREMREPFQTCISPIILKVITSASTPITADQILCDPIIALLARTAEFQGVLEECLSLLRSNGLIAAAGNAFVSTARGKGETDKVATKRESLERQAMGQFVLRLRRLYPQLSAAEEAEAANALKAALVNAFRERGIAMANVVFAGQSLGQDDMPDIFRVLKNQATQFDQFDLRAAFIESASDLLVDPSEPEREFLASISQGFFLYHMLGLDPTCSKLRQDLFTSTCWFIDSSVFLPFLAVGCYNHEYARDLFGRLAALNPRIFTTHKLLEESWYHFEWALNFVRAHPIDSPEFLAAVLNKGEYKQNLFIDGYVRLAAEGKVGTFRDYLGLVSPGSLSPEMLFRAGREHGVIPLRASELAGFKQEDWGEIQELTEKLRDARKLRGTFRGEAQVEAEAEVLQIIRKARLREYELSADMASLARVYFVSQSRALDVVSGTQPFISWTPEAVYRYIVSIVGDIPDPALLQQCMLHEYFYAGVNYIDKARYIRFFGPSINQARLSYREQVEGYLRETEQEHRRKDLDEAFERVPDLEKPFFVSQMGWQVARVAEQRAKTDMAQAEQRVARAEASATEQVASARARAHKAEARAAVAEAKAREERKERLKAEQDAARLRNLRDPKHTRKRLRQAKKRGRKNR